MKSKKVKTVLPYATAVDSMVPGYLESRFQAIRETQALKKIKRVRVQTPPRLIKVV
jgi:hypothetical protein